MAFLCLSCSKEIDPQDPRLSDKLHPNHGACPDCGSKGVPADLETRVKVWVTWHELRILTIGAERWASQIEATTPGSQRIIYGIADRIQLQHMDQKTGLTFASELAELNNFLGAGNVSQTVIREEPTSDEDASRD